MTGKFITLFGLFIVIIGLNACSFFIQIAPPEEETFRFERIPEADWPLLEDDLNDSGIEQALLQSLIYLKNRTGGSKFTFGSETISDQEILESVNIFLEIMKTYPEKESRLNQLKTHFNLYQIVQNQTPLPLLLTGYYEPTLRGSRIPDERYRYPIYRLPDDLLTIDLGKFSQKFGNTKLTGRIEDHEVVPYYTRREIDLEGRLTGKNLEILWVDDPIKLFFMHIQGSGQILLQDNSMIKLGYQASNGRAYFAIGKELIRKGAFEPEQVSLQSIYAYLKTHPDEQANIMNLNPSYIFFQEVQGGPFGSLGLPITPGRSVAADFKIFPPRIGSGPDYL